MLIALGVTSDGRKIPLGFAQAASENSIIIKELLQNLINRGLHYDQGLLFVVDGSKGIHKAIRELFGSCGIIQRCQWHKRENVLKYLNENIQDIYRRRINKAYGNDTYQEAKEDLVKIIKDLRVKNISAARSLEEGLEETLTLHRLGLHEKFSRSFNTTNCIENLNSMIGRYLQKVKNWKSSDQRYRWMAVALLETENRMRRVNNYKQLHIMKKIIKEEVLSKQQKQKLNRVA
jgi:transposase-like protein